MSTSRLLIISLCALALACGDKPAEDNLAGAAGSGGAAGQGGAAGSVEQGTTTLSLQVSAKSLAGNLDTLAGAKVYVEPYSSPEAAIPKPHMTFTGEPAGTTDANGLVSLTVEPGQRYVAHILAEGHGSVMRILEPQEEDKVFFVVTLLEMQTTMFTLPETGAAEITLGNSMGGTVDLVTLTIEAGDLAFNTESASSALRLKQNAGGDDVTGDIEVRFNVWDPFVDDPSSMPSDLATETGPIASYGMFEVEFFKDGVPVNVAEGQKVGWKMTLNEAFASQAASAFNDDHLNVYSMDGGAGLWIEDDVEKTYDPDTREFASESTHFSHKNCDDPGPYNCQGCVNVTVQNECGDTINQNVSVQVSGSSSGNSTGCHDLPSALDDPTRAKSLSGSVRASVFVPFRNATQSQSQNYNTSCDDNGSTGCGTNSCDSAAFTFDTMADEGESCTTRDDCGCPSDNPGLGCIDGSCQPCLGANADSRSNDPCQSTNYCCRAAANDLGVDLVCEDLRCVAP